MTRRRELILAAVGALLVVFAATLLLVRPTRQATAEAQADRGPPSPRASRCATRSRRWRRSSPTRPSSRPRPAWPGPSSRPRRPCQASSTPCRTRPAWPGSSWGRSRRPPPKASTVNPVLAEITTTVNVSGGYFEIQDFLVRLESLVKGSDPGRVDPRSVLIESVNLGGGSEAATGDSAAATADATTAPDELKGDIVLTVFQLAQPSGASSSPAAPATPAGQGAQVR